MIKSEETTSVEKTQADDQPFSTVSQKDQQIKFLNKNKTS